MAGVITANVGVIVGVAVAGEAEGETTAIENTIGSIRRTTRNVKRWRGGDMKLRWVALALCEAETRFRRVKGHRHLGTLELALANLDEQAATKAVA